MSVPFPILSSRCTAAAILLALAACSPRYDWRELHGVDAPYSVAMPARPDSFSRGIDLNGVHVSMTMTAAEVGKATFAVGSAELPTAPQAQASLDAMKNALVRNIRGTIRQEKTLTIAQSRRADGGRVAVIEVVAIGPGDRASEGRPRALFARFVAKDKRVFQVVATGPEDTLQRETVDTFFSSFRLD
ncbi:MAG TPA: hypothetical protein VN361_09835 [Oxalicibacterium sp.]|nr:hypothetical protein [Oxalicibacterium sp.]